MADWRNKPNQEKEAIKYRDYSIDNTPEDFSSYSEQSDADLKTIYNSARKRDLYIYPLNSLIKNSNNSNLYFSPNVVKIGFIDLEQVKKVVAYEVSDFVLELDARNPTNVQDNTVEYTMVDAKTIVFQEDSLKGQFNLHVVSIGKAADNKNLDELYLINSYTERYAPKAIKVTKEAVLVRVKDFKVRGSNPIIVRIGKQLPEDTKVKAITITYPRQALFGNIKVVGEIEGVEGYPKLFLEENKIALPMLAMPIEIEPKVRILQQWMSSQVLAWEKAKQYFNEGSVLDLIKIGGGTETRKKVITDARITQGQLIWITGTKGGWFPPDPPKWPNGNKFSLKDKEYVETSSLPNCLDPTTRTVTYISTSDIFGTIEIEIDSTPIVDSLQKVLLEMLNYTYNYRTNFKHAEYYSNDKENQFLYGQPKNAVAKLKEEKFVGQKPEVVITNIFEDWKFENPKSINNPSVEIFKQVILMLSEYIFCDLSINTGFNDDYKILLPYYFELVSQPILEDGEYKFKDIEVILKSEYFDFSNGIKLKNNDISQNKLFKLNSNQFNWLPLINNLEANDIPSLLPKDIKLADGNYGKNFVNLIIEKSKLDDILNFYGQGIEELFNKIEWLEKVKNLDNYAKFELRQSITKFKRLEISSIFGSGNYDFEIETETINIKINNIQLFNERTSSYIILEI